MFNIKKLKFAEQTIEDLKKEIKIENKANSLYRDQIAELKTKFGSLLHEKKEQENLMDNISKLSVEREANLRVSEAKITLLTRQNEILEEQNKSKVTNTGGAAATIDKYEKLFSEQERVIEILEITKSRLENIVSEKNERIKLLEKEIKLIDTDFIEPTIPDAPIKLVGKDPKTGRFTKAK